MSLLTVSLVALLVLLVGGTLWLLSPAPQAPPEIAPERPVQTPAPAPDLRSRVLQDTPPPAPVAVPPPAPVVVPMPPPKIKVKPPKVKAPKVVTSPPAPSGTVRVRFINAVGQTLAEADLDARLRRPQVTYRYSTKKAPGVFVAECRLSSGVWIYRWVGADK